MEQGKGKGGEGKMRGIRAEESFSGT